MSYYTLSSIVLEGENNCYYAKKLWNYVEQVRLDQLEKIEVKTILTICGGVKTIGQFKIYKLNDNWNEKHPVRLDLTFECEYGPVWVSSEINDDSFEFTDKLCKINTTDSRASAIIPWFTDYCKLTSKDGFYYEEAGENSECHTNDHENKYFRPRYELNWVESEQCMLYDKEIDWEKENNARRESAALIESAL